MIGIIKFWNWITKLFSKFDLYTSNLSFKWSSKKEGFGSGWGGLITIGTSALLIFITWNYAQDLFYNSNPTFIYEGERPQKRPFYNLTKENFTMYFRVEDVNGIPEEKLGENYYSVKFRSSYYWKDKNDAWDGGRKDHQKRNCTKEELSVAKIPFAYCIDWNYTDYVEAGGYWDETKVNYFEINWALCQNTSTNSTFCATHNQIMNEFGTSNLYASVFFTDKTLKLKQYLDYAQLKITNKYSLLDASTILLLYAFLKPVDIYITSGWFGQNSFYFSYLTYDYVETTFQTAQPGAGYVKYIFYISDKRDNYFLTYTSIPDVVSNVGGFLQIIVFIGFFLAPLYTSTQRDENTLNHLFNFYFCSKKKSYHQKS